MLLDQLGVGHLVVRRHRADDDGVAVLPDAAQALHAPEVDDLLGCVEPHAQDRQQGLAAGQDLALVTGLGERRERILDGCGGDVFER